LRLADDKPITQDQYWRIDSSLGISLFDKLDLSIDASTRQFMDDDRANQLDVDARLRFKNKFRAFGERFYYRFGYEQTQHDETYVSRRTGLVATFSGNSIADRYDHQQRDFYAQLRYKTRQNTQFALRISKRNKAYEDFAIAGLSNLSYDQLKSNLEIKYQASQQGRFVWDIWLADRPFEDKRAKDLDGNEIANTDLAYALYGTRVSYIYRPSDRVRWQYSFLFENRRDNEKGYWDAERAYLSVYGKYILADFHTLRLRFKLQKFSYDARIEPVDIDFDEANREHKGAGLKLTYQWDLYQFFSTQLAFYSQLEARQFDSTDADYVYDQNIAEIGIRLSL
jgi:hypothetical protein